jgi:hypothetical protein
VPVIRFLPVNPPANAVYPAIFTDLPQCEFASSAHYSAVWIHLDFMD